MFILENPFVSSLMLETLEKNNYQVLMTDISKYWNNDRFKLNFIDENEFIKSSENIENIKIYSNSENSINFITENFKKLKIADIINICKDKYEFRNRLMPIFPNFFFEEILFDDIENLDISEFPLPFIIKPAIGFLSMGVHKVKSIDEWFDIVQKIKTEVSDFSRNFPENVLNSSSFILEEIIKGDEFAIDAFYNKYGEPSILNIFQHPFISETDVSDRVYISSKKIIESNLEEFSKLLSKIGELIDIKSFPVHIEVIKNKNGEIIPVEINPMRFAGWCTTDLAYYAYGINPYEYFENEAKPNWDSILKTNDDEIYYFAMMESPKLVKDKILSVNYEKMRKSFSDVFEFRKIDYSKKPVSAIVFGKTDDYNEIISILNLDIKDFTDVK